MKANEHALFQYCSWDLTDRAVEAICTDQNLDLTYEDGIYFKLAIKNKNNEILKALLEKYYYTKLQDTYCTDYKISLNKLQDILVEASEICDIPLETQSLINEYIPKVSQTSLDKTDDILRKNYFTPYQGILDQQAIAIQKAKHTSYFNKLQTISLEPDLSKIPVNLKTFRDNLYLIQQEVQKDIKEAPLSDSENLSLRALNWSLEGYWIYLNPLLKDMEAHSPAPPDLNGIHHPPLEDQEITTSSELTGEIQHTP